jgi:hypothetical protein
MDLAAPRYQLPDHVYFSLTAEGAVFLDVKQDKYAGLGSEQTGLLLSIVESNSAHTPVARELLGQLLEQQLLTTNSTHGKPVRPISLERASRALVDLDTEGAPSPTLMHSMNLLRAYLVANYRLRGRSLHHAVQQVQRRRAHRTRNRGPVDIEAAKELVAVFYRLRPLLYVAADRCILDSLVLVEFLSRYQIFPYWIFGVKTGPFHAHSWVQQGNCVLNDVPEHVRGFTPILAV